MARNMYNAHARATVIESSKVEVLPAKFVAASIDLTRLFYVTVSTHDKRRSISMSPR